VRFHLGTVEVGARVVARSGRVESGAVVPVRLALDEPVVARSGDRFVLRAATPAVTIGGGVVTDPCPPARRAKPWPSSQASAAVRLGWIVNEAGGEGFAVREVPVRVGAIPTDVERLVSASTEVARIGDRLYSASLAAILRARLVALVDAEHSAHPLEAGLSLQHARATLNVRDELFEAVLGELVKSRALTVGAGVVSRAGWKPASSGADTRRLDRLAEALEAAGAEPPSVAELSATLGGNVPALLRVLERSGRAVAVAGDRYYSAGAVAALVAKLRQGTRDGSPRTASQIKEIVGLTRKYLIPFLEYCDRIGVSQRTGDTRVVR
jgi:selenocysteine-specific elongation factor